MRTTSRKSDLRPGVTAVSFHVGTPLRIRQSACCASLAGGALPSRALARQMMHCRRAELNGQCGFAANLTVHPALQEAYRRPSERPVNTECYDRSIVHRSALSLELVLQSSVPRLARRGLNRSASYASSVGRARSGTPMGAIRSWQRAASEPVAERWGRGRQHRIEAPRWL